MPDRTAGKLLAEKVKNLNGAVSLVMEGSPCALWLCVCVDAQGGMMKTVPGMVVGSIGVLKKVTEGSDLPCWFSATTWTS